MSPAVCLDGLQSAVAGLLHVNKKSKGRASPNHGLGRSGARTSPMTISRVCRPSLYRNGMQGN